jgi:4-amino-4-deoxy-L-arabinose transferase-like glycosyltransferase
LAGSSARDLARFFRTDPRGWALLAAFALVVIYSLKMSAAGAWDPWETHYGEVARQILVRHDPMDLWWQAGNGGSFGAYEKSFASKPALPFWCFALSMKLFGVGTSADPAEMVQPLWPELALRLPSMVAGLCTCGFLGYVVWKLASPRAGVLTALVLGTLPQFALVSRQALTDMFFVGPVVLALGAWAMAWMQPDRELKTRGEGIKKIPWDRAYLAFFVLLLIAAVTPLAVIHQHSFDPLTWQKYGRNEFRAKALHEIQAYMFVYWAIVVAVFVRSLRWRRRSQPWMGILYLAGGLSLIGKGLIGPGVIGVVVLLHLVVSGRWHLLLRCGLPTGILLFALPAFPWHHAMILYRGDRWIAEWIIDNNLRRFSTGEQKQAVGGFSFYLETLGIAALPWSALVPLSLGSALRVFGVRASVDDEGEAPSRRDRLDRADRGRDAVLRFAVLWFVLSLLVISLSTTKYYHYLMPSFPPLALILGLWIDRVLEGKRLAGQVGTWVGVGVAAVILASAIRDAINAPAWIAHLTTYLYTGMWTKGAPETTRLIVTCAPFAVGLVLWALAKQRWAVGAWIVSALLTTGYIIADYVPAASESWSQRSAMRMYFDERGPNDRLISWWFYYRGETFFTKGDVYVMRDRSRKEVAELFQEYEGRHDVSLWFITIESHAKRLATDVPVEYRDSVHEVYRSFHYVMLKVDL